MLENMSKRQLFWMTYVAGIGAGFALSAIIKFIW